MSLSSVTSLLNERSGSKDELIPILQEVQEAEGFLSPEALCAISKKLRISESEIFGVATFYAQFRFHPPGEHSIHICLGTACHVRGGEQLSAWLEHHLGIGKGQTTPDRKFDLNYVACLGCCALAPVVKIDEKINPQMSVLKLRKVMEEYENA